MAHRWCENCKKVVSTEKITYKPGLFLALSLLIFFMPIIGTFIGIPALILSIIWWIYTPSVCSECGSRNLKKLDIADIYQKK
ncbi:MAG: hypothetical protein SVN78_01905 [Deferribacterota bacterium]|nr:hypothetical protein [Deferribacterota bacterium]